MWQLTHLWQRKIRETLSQHGLTHGQFVLLSACDWLTITQELVTQVNLAKFTMSDIMMTSQVVRVLESKSLLLREPHPADTRAKVLKVTRAGHLLAVESRKKVEAVDQEFFEYFEEHNLPFVRSLQTLIVQADCVDKKDNS